MNLRPVRPFRRESLPPPPPLSRPLPPGPVDLEIGCGVGLHPIRYAQAHPERTLIAIEHTREKFEKFSRRLGNHPPLPNLIPVHANALSWVSHHLEPESVARCYLLYPNPNPKAEHLNRRWHAMPFMHRLKETLVRGEGTLTLATNFSWYFEEARDYLLDYWGFVPVSERRLNSENPEEGIPRTHFEKKYLDAGQTCFELVVRNP